MPLLKRKIDYETLVSLKTSKHYKYVEVDDVLECLRELERRKVILPDSNDLPDELKTAPIIRLKDVKRVFGDVE